jgi:hypothetical protein
MKRKKDSGAILSNFPDDEQFPVQFVISLSLSIVTSKACANQSPAV